VRPFDRAVMEPVSDRIIRHDGEFPEAGADHPVKMRRNASPLDVAPSTVLRTSCSKHPARRPASAE
jgi:hypothetical protein